MLLFSFFLLSLVVGIKSFRQNTPSSTSPVIREKRSNGDMEQFLVKRFNAPTTIVKMGYKAITTAKLDNPDGPSGNESRVTIIMWGSNDCKNWTILQNWKMTQGFWDRVQTYAIVPKEHQKSFFCYGVNIHHHHRYNPAPLVIYDVTMHPGPLECCVDLKNCRNYRGRISETEAGEGCQKWSENTYHTRSSKVVSKYNDLEERKEYGLEGNACRTPTTQGTPWCYTTSSAKKWRNCRIPVCPQKEFKRAAWLQELMGGSSK